MNNVNGKEQKLPYDIGQGAAEQENYLGDVFYSNKLYEIAVDRDHSRHILIGRTGSGKTAILKKISEENSHSLEITPSDLSLNYLINDSQVPELPSDVTTNIFFENLWKHMLVIEILKVIYKENLKTKNTFLYTLRNSILDSYGDNKFAKAQKYLDKFENSFWASPSENLDDFTRTVTTTVTSGIDGTLSAKPSITVGTEKERETAQSESYSITARYTALPELLSELNNIIDFIDAELDKKSYLLPYILIDDLDKDWADDNKVNELIIGLLKATEFLNNRIRSTKILVALREDILVRIKSNVSIRNFQEEKVDSLTINTTWNHIELLNLLNYRVNKEAERQKLKINQLKDLFDDGENAISYILERSLLRPRDTIIYLNECLNESRGASYIQQEALYSAEYNYSQSRLRALRDEWSQVYPELDFVLKEMFSKAPKSFTRTTFQTYVTNSFNLSYDTPLNSIEWVKPFMEEGTSPNTREETMYKGLFHIFYRIGIFGYIEQEDEEYIFSYMGKGLKVHDPELSEIFKIKIHPMLNQALRLQE